MIRTLGLLALYAALPACIFQIGGEKACDTSATGSVSVSVSAADGGDVSAAVVSFSVDGGASQPCDAFPGDGEYVCGWEVAGAIDVRVEAVGYLPVDQSVVVEQGECHVMPERLAIALDPDGVVCTAEVVPSVIATVSDSSGEALHDVAVQWGYRDADMAPQPCEERGDGTWLCGEEVSGNLEIYAQAGGHAGEMASVFVDADECHVITETVAFELEWLPD